jgi:hypothetical protein
MEKNSNFDSFTLEVSDFCSNKNVGNYQISSTTLLLPSLSQTRVRKEKTVNKKNNSTSMKLNLPNLTKNRARGSTILKLCSFLKNTNNFRKKVNKKPLRYKQFLSKAKYLLNLKKIDKIKLDFTCAKSELFKCIIREKLNIVQKNIKNNSNCSFGLVY